MPQAEARLKLGLPSDKKIILFNAGATPKVKRLDLAEEAVRRGARISLHVAGRAEGGPLRGSRRQQDCGVFAAAHVDPFRRADRPEEVEARRLESPA